MIRRQADGYFYLIRQHDHALLAGELAHHYGNARFHPPDPREETIRAISLHDAGWALHDDQPILNRQGQPLDVFDPPPDSALVEIALRVWREAADRAGGEPDYTQLLISLHILGLSAYAATAHPHRTRIEEFELNKFQHREIERQENLRRRLHLSLEIPLRLGLAIGAGVDSEEQLRRNHNILQVMDRMSLAICCTQIPFPRIEGIVPRPGAAAVTLCFTRTSETSVRVEPWPFDQTSITAPIPFKAVPARRYQSVEEFRAIYGGSRERRLEVTVHGGD